MWKYTNMLVSLMDHFNYHQASVLVAMVTSRVFHALFMFPRWIRCEFMFLVLMHCDDEADPQHNTSLLLVVMVTQLLSLNLQLNEGFSVVF